ncbi:putative cardiolipin synthase [Novosphingobium chloroacetimidivorans]|uniref:Phospholipase D n=1 Tax=Novosphingobium chloroacetimidivorans TaxID=1428314 RepID=A0A7W7NWG9_9SPHN|nr:phospholipase D family protein [Novosphingobium chloroacetimidivorans]MBB4859553.1 putative cardiolipin synthase [Novosphingobium chloroacetimidivorans]
MKRLKAFKLPPHRAEPPSHADLDTALTKLGREVESLGPDDAELTGLKLLRDGKDAFAARVLLARSAERTLDVQYYIWHDDLSGSLLLDELEAAARRGVRVRLIVDDIGTARLDARLACLDAQPNFEIRLYNPCAVRWPKPINYLFDFRRLNRRMHAKSFTVDSQATILGGRNIGDEYFAARKEGQFADLDVLAVGAVVPDVSRAFDAYWNGAQVRPVASLVGRVSAGRRRKVERARESMATSERAERYREAVRSRKLFGEMTDGTVSMIWARAELVNHDYQESGARDGPTDLRALMPAGLGMPESQIDIISGYFVPTARGTAELGDLARRGVRVRVLTNSFAATDVGFVHTGYAPLRLPLLQAGVRLFEMPAPDDKPKTARKFVRTRSASARALRDEGRSLHAKTIGVDGRQVYIGSANFDPRSAHLNTEMGLLIDSPELAANLARSFERDIAENVYCLGIGPDGNICWTDARDDDPEPESTEPGTNPFSRALVRALSRLPIEPYL